ncbi:MAG: hypothetical protein LBF15_03540 [Candidatus Peribacteria bacterium]|nr:hypothetical protein [Candidatus Peribacteria bacterium]
MREEISELEKEIKSEGVERSGHTKEVIYSDKNPALKHKVDVTSLKPGRTYISNQ